MKRPARIESLALGLAFACVVSGCLGVDRTLFVTKTNRGVDFSANPPTLAIDLSRNEGVLTPQFEEGKTAAVLASFKTHTNGIFAGGVGSAFATGDAATTLAENYDLNRRGPPGDGTLRLDQKPVKKSGKEVGFQRNDVRPLFFNTQTSLGLKLGWSNLTVPYPDSFTFGYNRKELAWLPVTMKTIGEGTTAKYDINQASLLATLEYVYAQEGAVNPGDGANDNKKKGDLYLQYFATGNAATQLATHPEVRSAMLKRLDPGTTVHITAAGLPVFTSLIDLMGELAKTDPTAASLLDKLDKKRFIVPDVSLPTYTEVGIAKPNSVKFVPAAPRIGADDYRDLTQYIGETNTAYQSAQTCLKKVSDAKSAGDSNFTFEGYSPDKTGVPTEADVDRMTREINALREELSRQQTVFSSDPDVAAAYQYMGSMLAKGF